MHDDALPAPPYPATWARMHGKGRVFYTSMGHREDVWTNEKFQQVALGGFSWVLHACGRRRDAQYSRGCSRGEHGAEAEPEVANRHGTDRRP